MKIRLAYGNEVLEINLPGVFLEGVPVSDRHNTALVEPSPVKYEVSIFREIILCCDGHALP